MKYTKSFYWLLFWILWICPYRMLATNISGGTVLYLDVSAVWSNYTSFSAEFIQSQPSNTSVVSMSKVANENAIWQVTAPAGMWDYVSFRCHNSGNSQVVYNTKNLEWCGTYTLFYITCVNYDACGGNDGGLWLNYLPLPAMMPTNVDSISIKEVCIDDTPTCRLSPFTTDEFVNYQWFEYQNGEWNRVIERDARPIVQLPDIKNDTVTYLFQGVRMVNNLVPNPDFEQGNVGFISDYRYAYSLGHEGVYTITDDIGKVHSSHPLGGYDHTYGNGTGLFMGVNGGDDPSQRVWHVSIDNIKPNTTYVFSAWVMDWGFSPLAELQFSINGQVMGGIVSPSGGQYYWTQLYTYWNSGTATSAEITLLDFQTEIGGNDFAIDDVFFSEVEEYSCVQKIIVRHCAECSVSISRADTTDVDCENGTYSLTGEVTFSNPEGDLLLSVDGVQQTIPNPASPVQFSFENLPVDYDTPKQHILTAKFSNDTECTASSSFGAPLCATPCSAPKEEYEKITLCDTLLPYQWRGRDLTEDGIYIDTLRDARLCDSVLYFLTLTIETCLPPEPPVDSVCISGIIYAKWNDVLFCDNSSCKYVGYQWYNNDVLLIGETKQYLYQPEGMAGTYSAQLTLIDGSIEWACPLDYTDIPKSADVIHDSQNQLQIWNSQGHVIYTGSAEELPSIREKLQHGIYIMRVQIGDNLVTEKWVL